MKLLIKKIKLNLFFYKNINFGNNYYILKEI